jgi:hypothetical protein
MANYAGDAEKPELTAIQAGPGEGREIRDKQGVASTAELSGQLLEATRARGRVSLSPIAFAFVASELVGQPAWSREEAAKRFEGYVAQSTGAVGIELWRADGTRLGGEERLKPEVAEEIRGDLVALSAASQPVRKRDCWVCPVRSLKQRDQLFGYVVVVVRPGSQVDEKLLPVVGWTAVSFLRAA